MKQPSNPIEILVHSTVRIECLKGSKGASSGTGYIFCFLEDEENDKSCPCIVTNKHVLKDGVEAIFHLTLRDKDGNPDLGNHEAIRIKDLNDYVILHPNDDIDLAIIPIGMILNSAEALGKNFHYSSFGKGFIVSKELLSELSPMEDIVMIGYPNGLWDTAHNLPIIRKGVTATDVRLDLNGEPEFMIDAGVYPGSSGSPVFLANIGSYMDKDGCLCAGSRIALLGTVYAVNQSPVLITSKDQDQDQNQDQNQDQDKEGYSKTSIDGAFPNSLGYVIKASELLAFDDVLLGFIEKLKDRDAKGVWDKSDNAPQSRNSPCHCGSGKRYKECHGKLN
ncbi:S1 family peptidase [Proteus mirabilis]|uniref:S1 family peptidase n=1 Tax=Proteus mirabilis TaxID=584 RepID=UPI0031F2A15B